jgi:tetratricopeptide (TPR) repeat protein
LIGFLAVPSIGSAAKRKKKATAVQLPEGNMGKKKKVDETKDAGPASLKMFEQAQFDERVKKLQNRKSNLRKRIIGKLESLLAKNPLYDNKAEVFHRLAESHWEESKYRFMLTMDDYNKRVDDFDAGTLKVEPSIPVEDYAMALEYYRKIKREFPTYHRIDEVIYYLAKGLFLEAANRKNPNLFKEGERNFKEIIKKHKGSRFLPEAHLSLGEYYFDNNHLFYAKNHYETIINNHRRSTMYNYALYKLAWVYYNLREFERSVATFKKVVAVIDKSKSSRTIEFREQALNDLVRVFAEVDGGWKLARDYFLTKISHDLTYKKLRKLGTLLLGMDRDHEAIGLYEHFIKKFSDSEECIEWWDNILGVRVEQQILSVIEKDTRRLVAFFNPEGSWTKVNRANSEAMGAAHKSGERRMLWIATKYHQEAQRLKKPKYYLNAGDLYHLFLEHFDDSKHAYRVNFYFAEILFDQKKDYKSALEQYEKVLERDSKGNYTEDAALGAIFCYDELMAVAGLRERPDTKGSIKSVKISEAEMKKSQELKKETPLSGLEEGFVRTVDTYVRLVTAWLESTPGVRKKDKNRGARIPEMSYIAAAMLYDHGKYNDAVLRLKVIFKHYTNHKFAAYAVNLLIDAYSKLGHWEKVEDWASKLIKARNFKVYSRKKLNKFRAIAIAERAREMALRKDYSNALGQNMRIYKEFRRARDTEEKELAATALFNNAVIHERARNIPQAIKTYQRVRKEFPKASIAAQAQFTIGVIYESQTQFAKAASAFEAMEKFKKKKEAKDAIRNAGLIWEAIGKPKKAIKAYKKYLKLFPGVADKSIVTLRIGVVQEEQGSKSNLQKARRHYEKYVKNKKFKDSKSLIVEAYTRAGVIALKQGGKRNKRIAKRHFDKALDLFGEMDLSDKKTLGRAKFFAAQAAFQNADFLYEEFKAISLDKKTMKNIRLMKKTLEDKASTHQAAEKAFQAILDFKEPQWNAAALFRNGLLYYEFARMLLDAPIPENLPIDLEDEYSYTLEQTAAPIEEKSLVAFKTALDLAHRQQVYNEWSQNSAVYAAKVNPDDFPVSKVKEVRNDHTLDTLGSASLIRYLKRGDIVINLTK